MLASVVCFIFFAGVRVDHAKMLNKCVYGIFVVYNNGHVLNSTG